MKTRLLVLLAALVLALGAFSGCSVTDDTNTSTNTGSAALAEQGRIHIGGEGYFNYQHVTRFWNGDFEGVTFTTYSPAETVSAPVAYWLTLTFADGAQEQVMYVGLLSDGLIDIQLSQHENPRAGVMIVAYTESGGLTFEEYYLVSTP
jgi:hypothetical protein